MATSTLATSASRAALSLTSREMGWQLERPSQSLAALSSVRQATATSIFASERIRAVGL